MPHRILKDSICASPELDAVSDSAEVLFYRLLTIADDFGRFDGYPGTVSSRCFARRRRSEGSVRKWLAELVEAGLIEMYEVDGREYGRVAKWDKHQRVRASNSKFPPPTDGAPLTSADIRARMPATRGHSQAHTKANSYSKAKADSSSSGKRAQAPKAHSNGTAKGMQSIREALGVGEL